MLTHDAIKLSSVIMIETESKIFWCWPAPETTAAFLVARKVVSVDRARPEVRVSYPGVESLKRDHTMHCPHEALGFLFTYKHEVRIHLCNHIVGYGFELVA